MKRADPSSWREIDRRILEFERASSSSVSGKVDLRRFLPDESDPHFKATLRELVLVDAEQRRELGMTVSIEDYVDAVPDIANDVVLRSALRVQDRSDELNALAPGDALGEFEIVGDIGAGSFSRVYLARQPALANRQVVIKVSSRSPGEVERLARLQHTNIVPLFSAHRCGPNHILCMPFLGRDTLAVRKPGSMADTLRLVAGLADGLGHAHHRGLLHLDIKPANVLISDDGVPMLLDFNLSADLDADAPLAGGTLAYMSPEQMRHVTGPRTDKGLDSITPAADVYAMGLLLFELLAAGPAFDLPARMSADAVMAVLEARTAGAIDWKRLRDCPRSTRAIVAKCLQPNAGDRYPTGSELAEDLRRELTDLPLKYAGRPSLLERVGKWSRRHPRHATAVLVGSIAMCVALGLGWAYVARGEQLARSVYVQQVTEFRQRANRVKYLLGQPAPTPVQLRAGLTDALRAIESIPTPRLDMQNSQTSHISPSETSELMILIARGLRFQATLPGEDRDALMERARQFNIRALAAHPSTAGQMQQQLLVSGAPVAPEMMIASGVDADPRSLYLQGVMHLSQSRWSHAARSLRASLKLDPRDASVWSTLGQVQLAMHDPNGATASFQTATALAPADATLHYFLGVAYLAREEHELAIEAIDRCLSLEADHAAAFGDRGLAKLLSGNMDQAIADFDRSIELDPSHTRAHLLRAQAMHSRDPARAEIDRRVALLLSPGDEQSAVSRGVLRLDDPQLAIDDFNTALRFNPNSVDALQNLAYVHAEVLGDPNTAVAWLDRLIETHPEHLEAQTSRAVLLARAGKHVAALEAAEAATKRALSPALKYQLAGVYAHASSTESAHVDSAVNLLRSALAEGYGHALIETDPDLGPIRSSDKFIRLLRAVKEIAP